MDIIDMIKDGEEYRAKNPLSYLIGRTVEQQKEETIPNPADPIYQTIKMFRKKMLPGISSTASEIVEIAAYKIMSKYAER